LIIACNAIDLPENRLCANTLYYGDVTQPEILRSAGIEHVKIFILAIDDVEDSLNVARHITLNYPNITLLARARDRHHVHLLRDLGVHYIWRETYLSSLGMAYRALRDWALMMPQRIRKSSCSVITMKAAFGTAKYLQ
jgi:voltage-gated potassium channel Kch